MVDEYIRREDAVDTINTNADDLEQNGGIPFAQGARAMAIVVEQMPPADVVQVDAIIQFIETRKQLHSSPAWYEFAIVKELDAVKRFVEKMDREE